MRSGDAFDVLVVGAGPAGIAAARAASAGGVRVGVVDDNPSAGGQIWRNEPTPVVPNLLSSMTIYDAPSPGVLRAESGGQPHEIRYRNLVLATGAREVWVPFPGWTLPHVVGAGGLQALVKSGLPIAGKRVVIAGSGPLLLAVAALLRRKGAKILLIAEQASRGSLAKFAAGLPVAKLWQAAQLQWQLRGVEYATSCWPVEAQPGSVVVQRADGQRRTLECDYVACGFGLTPNTQLAELLGCTVRDSRVVVNEVQQTSVDGIWCAGEATGIGGVELAELEGAIAGYLASDQAIQARALFRARDAARRFADALERAFALRPELKALPDAETIVCRCEDVTWGRLRGLGGWQGAKLQTRCGMGPCQGRVCGPTLQFLAGWKPESVRPPLYPVPVRCLTRGDNV